jgi:hypothetical protein
MSNGRPFARFYRDSWQDDEWRSLDRDAQHAYWLLLSQATITLAGTMPLQMTKWSKMYADGTPDGLARSLALLDERCFIVVDHDTEELLIRTLMRNDTLRNPSFKTQLGAIRHALKVESHCIRLVLADEMERGIDLFTETKDVDLEAKQAISELRGKDASKHASTDLFGD